ncbi:hypothetical protein KKE14_02160 [Patescibacteria group bacterium]|nr:hypothetical protein [Patescibacteria group bacterium]
MTIAPRNLTIKSVVISIIDFMQDKEKMLPWRINRSSLLLYGMVALLIIVGSISFVYADGLKVITNMWFELVLPDLSFEISLDTSTIPADGTTLNNIDTVAKNNKGQLLDGSDILVTVSSGVVDISRSAETPTNVSQRFVLRSPDNPQKIVLTFHFKHLEKRLELEAFDPTPPNAPIIKSPLDGNTFTTGTPTISGEVAVDSKMEIYIDDKFNSVLDANDKGTVESSLKETVAKGQHKLTAIAINKYGVKSQPTKAIYINVQTPDPEIDFTNIRIKPNPVKAGEAVYVFIPVSTNTKSVSVMIDGTPYPLKDPHQSSIFSGAIRAPYKAGLYRISAVIVSRGGDSILANNIASLRVQS